MKNITFSAQGEIIEKARQVAMQNNLTLNEMFRDWLASVAHESHAIDSTKRLTNLWERTSYLQVGKKLSRDEMNQR